MKTLLSLCVGAALCILASCSEGPTKQMPYNQGINVIPTPVSLVQNEGSFKLSKNTAFSASTPEAKTVAEYFAAQMNLATGYQITVSDKAASNGITLAIDEALDVNNEGYTLDVTPKSVTVKAKTPQGLFYGMQTFMQLLPAEIESPAAVSGIAWTAPCVTVKDEPRFEYRGIMLDPCRHFIPVENVKKHLDVLALFKINRMHWHLTDDQGWRIEIKKYPKLTEVGSKRIDGEGTEYSGFYTQDQIKEIVKYAADRFITIVPEIELPGHELAAISAYPELSCKGEPTTPRIIWGVEDIVLCAGKEEPFEFLQDVFDEVAPLFPGEYIHIGGDEVPRNAWGGSRAVGELMAAEGLENDKEVHARFIRRINDYLSSKGVKMSGWQEISSGHPAEYNAAVSPNVYSVNSWTQSSDKPDSHSRQALEGGYPLILSNVNHFYLDMAYSWHPHELGLTWGGTVDEFDALAGYPARLVEVKPGDKSKIFGVSGQLWAETLRDPQTQEALLLPKMLGMAERAWNADSTYSDAAFNAVVAAHEIPVWESRGYNYHLRQPGIKLADGKVMLNGAYPGMGEIRYTLDGTNPTDASAVYEAPFALPAGVGQIRAVYFLNGKKSVPSILFVD